MNKPATHFSQPNRQKQEPKSGHNWENMGCSPKSASYQKGVRIQAMVRCGIVAEGL